MFDRPISERYRTAAFVFRLRAVRFLISFRREGVINLKKSNLRVLFRQFCLDFIAHEIVDADQGHITQRRVVDDGTP